MLKAKIDEFLGRFDRWLWQVESAGSSKIHKALWHCARVVFAVIRDAFNGTLTLHAMSLVYTTLLSIVPLLAISFLALKGAGIQNELRPILEQYLAPLGDQADQIIENIVNFVDNVNSGVLGSVGFAFLIYTVISLVQKVERSFNEIWRVSSARSFAQRFSSYLSVIMVGPILMVGATAATTTIVSSDIVKSIIAVEPFGWLFATLSQLAPFIVMIGLFTFLYSFIPNTKVKIRYALYGGLVSGIAWQTAIIFFTLVVANSSNLQGIYRSFAGPIILLIWLYLSWLIMLIGASVSFYAQHAQQITRSRVNNPSAEVDELTGLAMLNEVGKQFYSNGRVTIRELESNMSVGPEVIQRMLKKLQDHHILVVAEDGNTLFPAQPFEELRMSKVMELLRASDQPLPASLTQYNSVMNTHQELNRYVNEFFHQQTVSDWVHAGFGEDNNQQLTLSKPASSKEPEPSAEIQSSTKPASTPGAKTASV